MPILYFLKVATAAGYMFCMTVQTHPTSVAKAMQLYGVEVLAAEATLLKPNTVFSGMQPYDVDFLNMHGIAGCFTANIFPK